jgi:phosphopentomutase
MTEGTYTLDGYSTNPPKTLISHTAMFTGLDYVGPEYGWSTAEYMEELSYIDDYLAPIIRLVKQQKNYLIIITSDHGGHDKIHGSQHPDDYKLPFITHSDIMKLKTIQNTRYSVTELEDILDRVLKTRTST